MGSLQALHTQRINADHGWSGHIWHSRYYSCVMDETHPAAVVRYVERNPVRAKLVGPAPDYAWSSAPAHSGLRKDPALSDDLPLLAAVSDWRRWLQGEDHPAVLARLRDCTGKDLPYGEPSFVEQIAQRLGRPLTKRPRGRPKKTEGVAAETGPE
jgi:putative transposase